MAAYLPFIALFAVALFATMQLTGGYETFVAPYVPSLPSWGASEWPWRWYQWSPWTTYGRGYPLSYRRRGMSYDIRGDPYIQPRMISPWYNPSVLPIRNRPIY